MEISLNLLPPRLLAHKAERRQRQQRILTITAAVLPIVLAYLALDLRIAVVYSQISSLEHRIAPLVPIASRVRQLEAERDAFNRRKDALSRLALMNPRMSGILVELSSLVPPDVWFTALRVTNGQIFIHGRSLDAAAVSTLSIRLANVQFMDAFSLKFIREEIVGGHRVLMFEITGALRRQGDHP